MRWRRAQEEEPFRFRTQNYYIKLHYCPSLIRHQHWGRSPPTMDLFTRLPPEIIVHIMLNTWDLPTLGYLLKASPRCSAVFDYNHVSIMDAFISNLPKDLSNLLVVLMNAQHQIKRRELASSKDLDQSIVFCLRSFDQAQPSLYDTEVRQNTARDIVFKSCTIQQITKSFFETYLKRMRSLELMHMAEDIPCHPSRPIPFETIPGRTYRPAELHEPSWIEEQRVIRALWRTQVYFDIRDLLTSEPGSAVDMWHSLHIQKPSDLWKKSDEDFHLRGLIEMDSVHDHLRDINSSDGRSTDNDKAVLTLPELILNGIGVSQQRPRQDYAADAWMQTEECLGIISPGLNYFITRGQSGPTSYIRGLSFEPFQRLGFGIWDRQKLATWEMMRVPRKAKSPLAAVPWQQTREEVTYTWRSVYSSANMRAMEATQL